MYTVCTLPLVLGTPWPVHRAHPAPGLLVSFQLFVYLRKRHTKQKTAVAQSVSRLFYHQSCHFHRHRGHRGCRRRHRLRRRCTVCTQLCKVHFVHRACKTGVSSE